MKRFLLIFILGANLASPAMAGRRSILACGQSNMEGQFLQSGSYTNTQDDLFGNDYVIHSPFADPYDYNSGQVDTVSADTGAKGSFWPAALNVMDALTTDQFRIVPCALGGSSIIQWQPAGTTEADYTNRATLFGSMVWRARQAGTNAPVICIGMVLEETDMFNSMSTATFKSNMWYFADQAYAALSIDTVWNITYEIANNGTVTQTQFSNITNAIITGCGQHHCRLGANLSVMDPDDGPHATNIVKQVQAGGLIATNIIQNFYSPTKKLKIRKGFF